MKFKTPAYFDEEGKKGFWRGMKFKTLAYFYDEGKKKFCRRKNLALTNWSQRWRRRRR